jgi:hypothetical protein
MNDGANPDNGFLQRNRWALAVTIWSALGVILFLYLFYASPATDIGSKQPIPFSHQVHAAVKEIQCQFCHPYVGRSTFPGIPPVEKCLYCHKYIIPKFPWIQKEHDYFNTVTPIPWRKVNYVPEFVFFNHQRHIRKEITCEECHGQVKYEDRLKNHRFFMEFCITCHEKKKANVECWLACHN